MPLALTEAQLQTLMAVATDIPPEKRSLFLERFSAMLALRGRGRFNNRDVAEVAKLASTGLASPSLPNFSTDIPLVPVLDA